MINKPPKDNGMIKKQRKQQVFRLIKAHLFKVVQAIHCQHPRLSLERPAKRQIGGSHVVFERLVRWLQQLQSLAKRGLVFVLQRRLRGRG